jgi:large subunit ribosomal protein L1
MAKKAELYAELKKLDKKTKLTEKNTIAEIEAAIAEIKAKVEITEKSADASTEEKPAEKVEITEASAGNIEYAKSGKRSKKHEEEVAAKLEKADRKADEPAPTEKKNPAPKARPLIERRGKNYRQAAEKVQKGQVYGLADAIKLAVETSSTKFDSTVEIHVRLGVDPKHADQNIRSTVALPNGTGKSIKVAALVAPEQIESVSAAGSDLTGEEAIFSQLDKSLVDFDVLIAEPQFMPKLSKYARLLGPKGLMPNPKSGTVSTNPAQAVKEAKAGKVEYRVDKQSIVHLGIGKVSFGPDKLTQNAQAFFANLNANKPSSIKGIFIISTSVSTTMGPGIKFQA